MSKNNYLLLFSISPVQSFISQARKTKDLYTGSRLLSKFLKVQLYKLKELKTDTQIIFPSDINRDSLPNRFVVKISAETELDILNIGNELLKNFDRILRDEFESFAKITGISFNKDVYITQMLNTFECYWASLKIEEDYKITYLQLEKIHAAAKNIRKFNQLNKGKGEQGRKCSLCGERNAYFNADDTSPAFIDESLGIKITDFPFHFIKNESLCTVCAIKRFYNVSFPSIAEIALKDTIPEKDIKILEYDAELFYNENLTKKYFEKNNIPVSKLEEIKNKRNKILKKFDIKSSDLPKYYALIMFDGDNMGKLLAGDFLKDKTKLEDFHRELSKALSENAEKAKKIVNKYGQTVYAGGDDFLGFVPLKNLMLSLKELRNIFKVCVNNKLNKMVKREITMSAGVVIAHYKIPLKTVLDWARIMEKEAKEKGGRDSFTIAVVKHSGEIHKTVWKWYDIEESNIDRIEKILNKFIEKNFSTNFIHTLEKEFLRLFYEEDNDKEKDEEKKYRALWDKQFEAELKRLINRSLLIKENKDKESAELFKLCKSMGEIAADVTKKGKNFYNYFELMKIIDFMARHLGG